MPHIASQILDKCQSYEVRTSKQAVLTSKRSAAVQRLSTATQLLKGPFNSNMPSLSLLETSPDNPHCDFDSIQHALKDSENITPISSVESVFELSSAASYENTPISTTSSLFVAELADTSHSHRRTSSGQVKNPAVPVNTTSSSKPDPSSATTTNNPGLGAQIYQAQKPTRSSKSSNFQAHDLHPRSSAATADTELHFDQASSPGSSARSSRSQVNLRSNSATPTLSPMSREQILPLPGQSSPFNPPAYVKSYAAIIVETMNAIEKDTQLLLERALAAEREAKNLQEINLSLQNQIVHCDKHHRPMTAPNRTRRAASEGTPVSSFNTSPLRRHPSPHNLTANMRSISQNYDLAAHGSPARPIRRPQAPAHLECSSISGPIPGSVVREQITYNGILIPHAPPIATISLAEARWREKPLPDITPLSPSMVPGFVEMGSKAEICAEERKELRKKKTFGNLFRWGKRQRCVKL